jgi:hypothetical protein
MDDTPTPKGFRKHHDKWRADVLLDLNDATDVAAEADERGTTPAAVMRERIRIARRKPRTKPTPDEK